MEGTEDGMKLAIHPPKCLNDGNYDSIQCKRKTAKMTRKDYRKMMEEQNVRQMRRLLDDSEKSREKRSPDSNIRLFPIESFKPQPPVLSTEEEKLISNIFSGRLFEGTGIEERHAKIIDFSTSKLQEISNTDKPFDRTKSRETVNELIEVDIDDCWCVDGFGTEIPKTRSVNTTRQTCEKIRETLECLDLTCRMGCDYGFVLNPETQCPSCDCRDPCDGIECGDGEECRTVEVSCEGEYCPAVPACLPRKPGQCPFLVPPGSEDSSSDVCDYECRSDYHCDGDLRCCSNGCGTQCVQPQLKTACQHLQTIQLHQTVELGVPARHKYIAQCNDKDGSWLPIQCGPDNICWCVDEQGNERSGTRTTRDRINCNEDIVIECPMIKCMPCENGYRVDEKGCRTCECRDPCSEISCPRGEMCELVQVECIDSPCPKMPICVPFRESSCTEGIPYKVNGRIISCGPQSDIDQCPTTHTCQLNPMTHKGVCCQKTRDVCFESLDDNCISKATSNSTEIVMRWKFSPRQNKCISISLPNSPTRCQSKNIFDAEAACKSVCPVLSQCERLRLKNMLAAKRAGPGASWFSPRCDPDNGTWSPIQCLGQTTKDSRSISNNLNVCWCADKKGAPMKGSLTRGTEPKCNHRQARRRMGDDDDFLSDPVMEELIRQMTIVSDNDIFEEDSREKLVENVEEIATERHATIVSTVTEKILDHANLLEQNTINSNDRKQIVPRITRCNAIRFSASFPVACDEDDGSFLPTQCNGDTCWCVDTAGNQLPFSNTFQFGAIECIPTPVETVQVELHLNNPRKIGLKDVYDVLREEVRFLLGYSPDNFRVRENMDGSITLRFDLIDENKVDLAFALEELVKQDSLRLYHNHLTPDITQSRFLHHSSSTNLPTPQKAIGITENTFHMVVFIIATGSAFLVSIFVVYVMLKRGKNKMTPNHGDKYVDYSSPIFVLSAKDMDSITSNGKFHQFDKQ